MGENLYCEGNKVLSKEGWDNWDNIFSKKRKKSQKRERPATQDDVFLMERGGATMWATEDEVPVLKRRGWRLLQ